MRITKLKIGDIRRIVNEEYSALNEQVDHESIKDVVTGAQKLLAAVENFKATAPHAAINAVTPSIDTLEQVLEDMLSTPGSYVQKQKPTLKKVTLKPVKS